MTTSNDSEINNITASEHYRFSTFDRVSHLPSLTRHQLALAGLILHESACVCRQCGIAIDLTTIDENREYAATFFRKLHREKVTELGKHCGFLLCEFGTNIDDRHESIIGTQKLKWDDAEVPEFNDYAKRLATFDSWPEIQSTTNKATQIYVTPAAMAKHGFFFSGLNDSVTCFYCGNTLSGWSSAFLSTNENIVQLEHARFFPCRFINYTAGRKFVANAGYLHTVSPQERRERNPMSSKSKEKANRDQQIPQTIDECLATYDDWPQSAPVSAQALADAGFYYLGKDLHVQCFVCQLEVSDWRHGMTALGTHRKRNNGCQIILAIDSTATGDVQTVNEKWRLETLMGLAFNKFNSNSANMNEADTRVAQDLAACGFYRFKNTNIIRCAFCGVTIEPKLDQSIMSQHRQLVKQSILKKPVTTNRQQHEINVDCPMVRAHCPANIVIPHRGRFPEYPKYQSVFDRIQSFKHCTLRRQMSSATINDMAQAGFFLDNQRMRCFQCGNSLLVNDKARKKTFPNYNMAKIHAHFYPTCEWIKEVLGTKYIAQVLHDRYKSIYSTDTQPETSLASQYSSSSSFQGNTSSSTPVITTPLMTNTSMSTKTQHFDDQGDSDRSDYSSSNDGFEPVAAPSTAVILSSPLTLQSISSSVVSTALMTSQTAQTCFDPALTANRTQLTSPAILSRINPFEQLHLQNQQQGQTHNDDNTSNDNGSQEISPSVCMAVAGSSPVEILALLAHESNRLETFRRLGRSEFANVNVAYLAYVGFFMNSGGDFIQCPWCDVKLTEEQFLAIVNARPSVARPTFIDEPWTPMRVHRHANGVMMNRTYSWCTLVRREAGGPYPNVTMLGSQMLYPEYPSYSKVETRIKSFTSDWSYPSGSRLSNQQMAQAGFFYLGDGCVCCYYCGNKLQKFEPRDCPFEEHATFFPLCDYIQKSRGLDYVNRIILEYGRIPQGRLRYETDGEQQIKRVIFDKSGPTKRKIDRQPVNRINSHLSSSSLLISNQNSKPIAIDNNELIEDACILCTDKQATHEYDLCRHCPMCGECFAKLEQIHLERCMYCFRPGTIRMRVPTTPSTNGC